MDSLRAWDDLHEGLGHAMHTQLEVMAGCVWLCHVPRTLIVASSLDGDGSAVPVGTVPTAQQKKAKYHRQQAPGRRARQGIGGSLCF